MRKMRSSVVIDLEPRRAAFSVHVRSWWCVRMGLVHPGLFQDRGMDMGSCDDFTISITC